MSFDSWYFILFIVVALSLYHFVKNKMVNMYILLIINIVFVSSFVTSISQFIPLAIFLLLGYLFINLSYSHKNKYYSAIFILTIVTVFIYLKRYTFFDFLPFIKDTYLTVGLSYILFRIIQVILDVQGGSIVEKISLISYLNFTCFFLNYISGPIQRYQDFNSQLRDAKSYHFTEDYVYNAFARILNGYFKIIFISSMFYGAQQKYNYQYALQNFQGKFVLLTAWYIFAVVVYTYYLYFNFSGYMDVVIGLGELFSIKIPENFNKPFSSNNFLDFWSRWHMTLSEWFKIYFFNPLLKYLMLNITISGSTQYLGVIAFSITFFVMGLWHGTTKMFLIYGIFLGIGVSANKLYQVIIQRRIGKKTYNQLNKVTFYKYICRGMTLSYFFIALTCLWMKIEDMLVLYGHRILLALIIAYLSLTIFSAIISYVVDQLLQLYRIITNKVAIFNNKNNACHHWWLATKFLLLFYLILKTANRVPEFVYKAF